MSTLKNVGNKIFKTELGNQKVELASYQDVIKEFDNIVSKDKTISNTLLNSLNEAGNKYNSIYNDYLTNLKKAESLKADIEKLGLKVPQDLQNLIKSNVTTSSDIVANLKNIKKLITTI